MTKKKLTPDEVTEVMVAAIKNALAMGGLAPMPLAVALHVTAALDKAGFKIVNKPKARTIKWPKEVDVDDDGNVMKVK